MEVGIEVSLLRGSLRDFSRLDDAKRGFGEHVLECLHEATLALLGLASCSG